LQAVRRSILRPSALPCRVSPISLLERRRMSCPFDIYHRLLTTLLHRFTGEPRKALQAPRHHRRISSIHSSFRQICSPKGSSSIPVIVARVCALPCRVSPISLPEGSAFSRMQEALSCRRSAFLGLTDNLEATGIGVSLSLDSAFHRINV